MNSRQLGQSGRVINEITYGNWITHGSQVEKDTAIASVRAALEEGVTTSDTADVYARIAAFVLVAVAGVCGVSVCAGETAAWTPARLWQGFDPEQEPLEIEVVQEWSEQGVRFQKLFFTGERAGDVKVRVFAIVGMPAPEAGQTSEKQKLPGVLHIHGGGQTASAEWVAFWCQRGYACASFDYCGRWQKRKEFTDWGPLTECNMAESRGGMQVSPSPRASSWFHWAVVARRALTLLARQPAVDRERLGIFGVSMGGSLCWSVAGTDDRVRAAVPIYGCGYNTSQEREQLGFAKLTPEEEIWQRCLSPESYAPAIKCPVLLLNASNDFHGWFDFGPQVLAKVQGETRAAWTPNANHHIAQEQGIDLPAWMDWQLRGGRALPRSPKVSIVLDAEGLPQCHVVGDAEDVARIDVFYAMGDHAPPNRFWRKVEAVRKDGEWQAAVPVVNVSQPVHAFANAYYKRPVCVSSAVCTVVPGQLGAARAELKWSDRLTIPGGWRYLGAHADPSMEREYLKPPAANDPGALRPNDAVFDGKIPLNAATNFLADPQFAPRAGDDLSFRIDGKLKSGLTVVLVSQKSTPAERTYRYVLTEEDVEKSHGRIRLSLRQFRTDDGTTPTNWDNIDTLQFDGTAESPITVGEFSWSAGGLPDRKT